MGQLHTAAQTKDLPPGGCLGVEIEGVRIAIFNMGGTYFALEDNCPHSGAPLSEGDIDGDTVFCPWHGAVFKLADGSVQCPPAETGVTSYRIEVDGGDIKIELP